MKIAVIGNAAGGKTRLSRKLSKKYAVPVFHLDAIQFIPPMQIRPLQESRRLIEEIMSHHASWIIDGYGPLDLLTTRLRDADTIVFIDLPLSRHFFWFLKRQIQNFWSPRKELPQGCSERSLRHTIKVLQSMNSAHKQMRPELIRILNREPLKSKLIWIRSTKELQIYSNELS